MHCRAELKNCRDPAVLRCGDKRGGRDGERIGSHVLLVCVVLPYPMRERHVLRKPLVSCGACTLDSGVELATSILHTQMCRFCSDGKRTGWK